MTVHHEDIQDVARGLQSDLEHSLNDHFTGE